MLMIWCNKLLSLIKPSNSKCLVWDMIQAYGQESELMIIGALSPATRKDYIRAEDKLQSTSSLICLQVITPQVSFSQTTTLSNIFQGNQHNKLHISQNTSISLGKSKLLPQFRNAMAKNPITRVLVLKLYISRKRQTQEPASIVS